MNNVGVWNDPRLEGLPKKKGHYLCRYKCDRLYNVLWFEGGKWFTYRGGVRWPERYEIKTVNAWSAIEMPIFNR